MAHPGFRGDLASSHGGALRKRRPVSEGAIKLPYCTRTLPHRVCATDGVAFCLALTTVEPASGVRHLCGQRDGFMLADVHHPLRDGASREAFRHCVRRLAPGLEVTRLLEWAPVRRSGAREMETRSQRWKKKKKNNYYSVMRRVHVPVQPLVLCWILLSRPAYRTDNPPIMLPSE